MRKSFVFKSCLALACVTSVLSLLNNNNANAQDCPFADDDVVVCSSPSTMAKIGAFQDIWSMTEVQKIAKYVAGKVDESVANEKDEEKKAAQAYISSVLSDGSGKKSFAEAAFNCYFKYVDNIVLAVDVPENPQEPKDVLSGITLTYVLGANPAYFDGAKLLKEGNDFEVIKNENATIVGKIFVKDNGELKATVYFGITQVKDVDKYVLVLGGSQASVEKKTSRFQNNNEFVVSRWSDEKVYFEYIVKTCVFEAVAKGLATKKDDPNAVAAADFLKKVKSFSSKASGSDKGIVLTSTTEVVDSETAQNLCDLANGGLAVLRMKVKNAENLPKEAAIGVELLKNVEVVCNEDKTATISSLKVGVAEMKEITKIVCDKIIEQASK